MALTDRVTVNIEDRSRPLAVPTLSEVLLLGTTTGKSIQNEWRQYESYDAMLNDYDVTDNEAILGNTFFAQSDRIEHLRVVNINRADYRKATLKVGDNSNDSEITFTSTPFGEIAENIYIEIDDSQSDASLAVAMTKELVTGASGTDEMTWTSQRPPSEKVAVIMDDSSNSQSLGVEVTTDRAINGTFHTVKITLETDAGGVVQTTADEIPTLISGNAEASSLVSVSTTETGTVSGVSETDIPIDITITLATDSVPEVTSTATEVVELINDDSTVTKAISAAITGTGNDGSGTAVASTRTALSRGSSASPAELSRALSQIIKYEKRRNLDPSYFLLCTSHEEESGDRLELSNAVAARRMFYLTGNKINETPEEINDLTVSMASERSLVLAHTDQDRYPEAGLAAQWAGSAPGSFTNAYKELNTFNIADYDDTDVALIEGQAPGDNGAFTIEDAYGAPVTSGSWATNGTFADLRRNKDWIIVHTKAAILFELINRDIILFDRRGFAVIRAALEGVMTQANTLGIVADHDNGEPFFEITMPSPLDVPVLNRADRNFAEPGPQIDLRLAGAIEKVTVDIFATV